VDGESPSTRAAAVTLAKVSTSKNVLVVAERSDELTWRSLRNVTSVHVLEPTQLNTYDVLISDDVIFTSAALATFVAGPVKGGSVATTGSETAADTAVVDVEKKDA
jgi:large subunit ribosomal protein L4